MARGDPPEDDALDVIDLLAEDATDPPGAPAGGGSQTEAEPPPRRRSRTRVLALALTLAVAVAATATYAATRDRGGDAGVGIAGDEGGEGGDGPGSGGHGDRRAIARQPEATELREALPDRFAFVSDGELVVVDGPQGAVAAVEGLPDAPPRIGHRDGGRAVVAAGNQRFTVDATGAVEQLGPALGGTPVRNVEEALALLDAGPTLADDLVAGVVALHPDRVAWSEGCPGACRVHVTDRETRVDRVLPADAVRPDGDLEIAPGRFSADGRHLAIGVASRVGPSAEIVVVDLTTGDVRVRRELPAAGESSSAPFDFSAGGSRFVVAGGAASRSGVAVYDVESGDRITWIPEFGSVTGIASLDLRPTSADTPLFEERASPLAGKLLAGLDPADGSLTITDLGAGSSRRVALDRITSPTADCCPVVVATTGGFVAVDTANAWWVPVDGAPRFLGPATNVLVSADRAAAWLVRRGDPGPEVVRVDGDDGSAGPPIPVFGPPRAVSGDTLVAAVPGALTKPSHLQVWQPGVADPREIVIEAELPGVVAVTGGEAWWVDESCTSRSGVCDYRRTDLTTGETRAAGFAALPWTPTQQPGTDATLYVTASDGGLVAVDLQGAAVEVVPISGQQFDGRYWVANDGTLAFVEQEQLFAWRPGWEEPRFAGPAPSPSFVAIAMR